MQQDTGAGYQHKYVTYRQGGKRPMKKTGVDTDTSRTMTTAGWRLEGWTVTSRVSV